MDLEPVIAALRAALPDLAVVYLFGSACSGETHPESDVDLAFLAHGKLDAVERFELQERLAATLHRSVDLVDLRTASTVLRVQVISGGRVIYERDAGERAGFEATALGAYARLNEERRGILEDVRSRGCIHG
jgi:predicted nucleotidyltransferase